MPPGHTPDKDGKRDKGAETQDKDRNKDRDENRNGEQNVLAGNKPNGNDNTGGGCLIATAHSEVS